MKRVRIKPIGFLGLALFTFGMFGDRILGITDRYLRYGFVIVGIIGLALLIIGKEIYESED